MDQWQREKISSQEEKDISTSSISTKGISEEHKLEEWRVVIKETYLRNDAQLRVE